MTTKVVVNPDWFDDAMNRGGSRWLDEDIGGAILKDAKAFVPVDSGDLQKALDKELVGNDEVRIGPHVGKPGEDYAASVELGNPPHDIPNAFGLGITVRHPGYEPQPYLSPALYRRRA